MSGGFAEARKPQEHEQTLAVEDALSPEKALATVRDLLVKAFAGRPIRIYEAGGGSLSVLPLDRFDSYTISVVDVDEEQLRNNTYADEKILGNIETYSFPPSSFDLIMCHNVIEHLEAADQAIQKFHSALAPGGLVFISAPNPESFFGMITKHTPHWFHVWVYRVIFRHKDAGLPGKHPFRTVFHPVVYPAEFQRYCVEAGFEIVYFKKFLSKNFHYMHQKRPVLGRLLGLAIEGLDILTLYKFPLLLGDYHAVLRKPAVAAVRS
ncbi:class I SAM-dependent methyltransferase [Sinorhizobium meliloti]|uniref:class I SAM-dependent methyltransferase n=1 Tax=Rhizobium meliloti TaxID=382 RepID=UPI0023800F6E|nr:class I SAM-dependent methyltransferase [Sinorhizobium meliloti]MDE3816102.1 class I SAM-dependent methyltransferase [Sinorhizobium meliloti]MDW9807391.1 methyltransferase domain-containing protein [Sinorhizobium meliloti]MDX0278482.1 methyltransferase domain-containing protein [Sinorhizobium meliloti]